MLSQELNIDDEGTRYVFVDYNKKTGWEISPTVFRLNNKQKGNVSGQFLSSMWFSCKILPEETKYFMILGINKSIQFNGIRNLLNRAFTTNNISCSITNEEKEFGIVFKDAYILKMKEHNEVINGEETLENKEARVKINGEGGYSSITISTRAMKKREIYITLPDFKRIAHYDK